MWVSQKPMKKKDARIKHGREGEWLSLQITLGE